ncbi:MAG: DUF3105 domain-containing protein [Nitrospinota bacterium]|jgi:hypothetical protein|nr:DUF3105 domain-containing protein [Nitrospinota bacterium]
MADKSRKERRQQEREDTREARRTQSGQKGWTRGRKKFLSTAAAAVGAAAAAYGVYAWFSRDMPGEVYPSQGNRHVAMGLAERFPYNTNPPTSGNHYGGIAPWGVRKKPILKGLQTHNLEDGGVIVSYRCRDCPDLIRKIEEIVDRYPTEVIAAPYPKMKPLIALTAWTRIDRLDKFDEKRIVRFIEAYKGIDHHAR